MTEDKPTLRTLLRDTEEALHAANMAFAAGVECCAPEVELLALAHAVACLQLAMDQALADVLSAVPGPGTDSFPQQDG
jgi:hypothetical protein